MRRGSVVVWILLGLPALLVGELPMKGALLRLERSSATQIIDFGMRARMK